MAEWRMVEARRGFSGQVALSALVRLRDSLHEIADEQVRFHLDFGTDALRIWDGDFLSQPVADLRLGPGGALISPDSLAGIVNKLQTKSINVALLGVLSTALDIPVDTWEAAIRANLAEKHHRLNLEAFHHGRNAAV